MDYEWPGNVRELKNCIEGMVVMCPREGILEISDIPPYMRRGDRGLQGISFRVGMTLDEIEKGVIEETLKSVNYDRRRAAEILDIGLSTIYRKIKEYGLN